jgi:enoyl-CoA hydratase
MVYENISLEIKDGIATIKINRPKALNALNTATLDDLLDAEKELAANDLVRVIIVTGEGTKAFVSGGDIREMKDLSPMHALDFSHKGHLATSNLEKMRKPVIAAVNGYALGGGLELALSCDVIYASEKARLGFPEVTLGIVPGFGGTQRPAKLVGLARAKELVLSGKVISAREAYEMGLINKVVPDDQLMAEVWELAKMMAAAGPIAVAFAKDCVNRSLTLDIDSGLEYETQAFALCCGTEDKNEAMAAFLEKRKTVFRGR